MYTFNCTVTYSKVGKQEFMYFLPQCQIYTFSAVCNWPLKRTYRNTVFYEP